MPDAATVLCTLCCHRNVPIAVLSSVAVATVLYVLTNISYFSVLSPDQLLASDAVAIVRKL